MIVVSNASPLITLARIGRLEVMRELFARVQVADEVRIEVVVRGAGRPGSVAVATAAWIECHPALPAADLLALRALHPLGTGELATVLLAQTLRADLVIIDERNARRLARSMGLPVMGCIGILELAHRRGLVADLAATYGQQLAQGIRVDRRILDQSLDACGLSPL